MKTNRITIAISAAILAFSSVSNAREKVGGQVSNSPNTQEKSIMGQCAPATAEVDLDINNVRAKILDAGDMWWDIFGTQTARYQVPKVTASDGITAGIGPSSQFATSIWIGGYDAGGQLKEAAQLYRQDGNDFWPGPLTSSATTDATTCLTWDKFWKINRADVKAHFDYTTNSSPIDYASLVGKDVINTWPAYGPDGQALAPYYDYNGNGIYDPDYGDVPDFDITGARGCAAQLFGDQCIFWVFNDKGNIHSNSGGASIGLEIQAQAFAFQTTDELNNATFLKYKVINKSSFRLDSTFFGIWDDADLGFAFDDLVGCDVERGLGILYNGAQEDGSGKTDEYGANPPAIGIDFFEGPYADPNGIDDLGWPNVPHSFTNYRDSIIDNERLGMGRFMTFKNTSDAINGNPGVNSGGSTDDYYQFLTATWKNGTPITYGGNGQGGSTPCNYMYPGSSDPLGFGTNTLPQSNWEQETSEKDDQRFVESAGPFKLQPGAVNTVTVGVPWARTTQGGPLASVALLLGVDDKAQELFNNCFAALDGPTAPNLTIQELDKELILYWSNPKGSNNYKVTNEDYSEDYDKTSGSDSLYRFQGYQVFQLKDGNVSITDIQDVSKARLVFQCDKADGVSQIVNYYNDPTISATVPRQMVDGANKGITHSLKVTQDKFASGDNHLINHKTYYFAVVAYGYTPTRVHLITNTALKDYLPYIAGRKYSDGVFNHTAIPHIPSSEANGTGQNSAYGTGPKLKRIEGQGNGGNILDLTSESVAGILSDPSHRITQPIYENSHGPVTIQVIDPLNVPEGDFQIKLIPATNHKGIDTLSTWVLINMTTHDTVFSETTIQLPNEQIINGQPAGSSTAIPKWGLSVNIQYTSDPSANSVNNSFLEATEGFADPSKFWLAGVPDQEGETDMNWIRSGTATFPAPYTVYNDIPGQDDQQIYEKLISGTWAPYRLCASTPSVTPNPLVCRGGPAWGGYQTLAKLNYLASVDVVIDYSHPENWTRCPVLEEQEEKSLAIGNARKMDMRNSPSVDKAGRKAGDAGYNAAEGDLNGTTGMGWFPGYAINIETGERLNMAFGEDSWLPTENGNDMKWNPTSNIFSYPGFDPLFGGKHYIYVFGHNGDRAYSGDPQMGNGLKNIPRYDEGKTLHDLLAAATATQSVINTSDAYKRGAYTDAMWVNIPLLNTNHSLFETAVKIRLRVTKSYQKGYSTSPPAVLSDTSLTPLNRNFPMYTFNTTDIKTSVNDNEVAKNALDLINIVPNPYYAYSGYEQASQDRVVKITNLPEKCTISIYSLNGTLIRRFKVDQSGVPSLSSGIPLTSQDWNLENSARIPISSGMYIINIEVPNVGEKTLKWFGIMRPLDLESY